MSKKLQIGSDIFNYPEEGDKAGWGESATEWASAVTDALSTVQGPNDILITSATLANNQAVAADIPGLSFNTGEVQHVSVQFLIIRTFDAGATTVTESGTITGNYDGTDFYIAVESVGESGVELTVTSGGQFQYTSDDKTNHVSSEIRFKGQTIDTP